MTDTDEPKRGRGRPRLNPVEGSRRSVTVQISVELYDQLKVAAGAADLSFSREVESRLQDSFAGKNALNDVAEAISRATADAMSRERERIDDEYVEEFHGKDGMLWAKLQADLYKKILPEARKHLDPNKQLVENQEFIQKLLELTISGQRDIVDEYIVVANGVQSLINIIPDFEALFQAMEKIPELKERVMKIFVENSKSQKSPAD